MLFCNIHLDSSLKLHDTAFIDTCLVKISFILNLGLRPKKWTPSHSQRGPTLKRGGPASMLTWTHYGTSAVYGKGARQIYWYHIVVCVLDLHFTLEWPWLGRYVAVCITMPMSATFTKLHSRQLFILIWSTDATWWFVSLAYISRYSDQDTKWQ